VNVAVRRSARAALDAARPAVARLDEARGPEDLAADLIETWSAVESALRSLVGGSALTGQALIREARQAQAINFDQANALADFQAARARLDDHSYRPGDGDVNAARMAFLKIDSALASDAADAGAASVAAAAVANAPAAAAPAPIEPVSTGGRGVPVWAALLVAVIAIVVIGGVGYYAFAGRRSSGSLEKGVQYYNGGQREAAVGEFNKAVRENPKSALPHIYLARMAREAGNFSMASQELQLALTAEPANALALREMGANLLTQGNQAASQGNPMVAQQNFDLARRFYVRAVQADPNDKTAQGYLGCTLVRLGRTTEAANFLTRAGQGPWSSCQPAGPMQPGMPGMQPGAPGTVPAPGSAPVLPRP
jgi:tetratricopeptide (TPR) repeat protein